MKTRSYKKINKSLRKRLEEIIIKMKRKPLVEFFCFLVQTREILIHSREKLCIVHTMGKTCLQSSHIFRGVCSSSPKPPTRLSRSRSSPPDDPPCSRTCRCTCLRTCRGSTWFLKLKPDLLRLGRTCTLPCLEEITCDFKSTDFTVNLQTSLVGRSVITEKKILREVTCNMTHLHTLCRNYAHRSRNGYRRSDRKRRVPGIHDHSADSSHDVCCNHRICRNHRTCGNQK